MPKKLNQVVGALQELAPLDLASEWDNVGLLVQPSKPKMVSRIFLTIDLTEAVFAEAVAKKVQLIVAYHPPIFNPIKRLSPASVAALCLEAGIAVYSPHTALDAVEGGVNDWLCEAFDLKHATRYSIEPAEKSLGQCKLVVFVPQSHVDVLREELAMAGAGRIGDYRECSYQLNGTGTFHGTASTQPTVGQSGRLERVEEVRLEMVCPDSPWVLQGIESAIQEAHPYEEPAWELYPLRVASQRYQGQGRDVCLHQKMTMKAAIGRIKKHLGLKHVRVAYAADHRTGSCIEHVMLCAGAGGSVLGGHAPDLFLTGEMRHHDVLAANARGTSVILTEHTNCERPYLPTFKKKLKALLGKGITIDISRKDADPLQVV
jgi:dinuclear metal center YbgI/SA1388 family protein